jgi:hypothetical protein
MKERIAGGPIGAMCSAVTAWGRASRSPALPGRYRNRERAPDREGQSSVFSGGDAKIPREELALPVEHVIEPVNPTVRPSSESRYPGQWNGNDQAL